MQLRSCPRSYQQSEKVKNSLDLIHISSPLLDFQLPHIPDFLTQTSAKQWPLTLAVRSNYSSKHIHSNSSKFQVLLSLVYAESNLSAQPISRKLLKWRLLSTDRTSFSILFVSCTQALVPSNFEASPISASFGLFRLTAPQPQILMLEDLQVTGMVVVCQPHIIRHKLSNNASYQQLLPPTHFYPAPRVTFISKKLTCHTLKVFAFRQRYTSVGRLKLQCRGSPKGAREFSKNLCTCWPQPSQSLSAWRSDHKGQHAKSSPLTEQRRRAQRFEIWEE